MNYRKTLQALAIENFNKNHISIMRRSLKIACTLIIKIFLLRLKKASK